MSKNDNVILNEDIDFPQVRCIGDDGEQYGLLSSEEALKIADSKGLDLVLIAPDAKPPVCKIMDYGKFRYQQEKKQKEAKKKQKQIEVKEIKLSVKIADNDINYKVKHAKEFLQENKHVRFRVFLRGREVSEPQVGFEVLNKVAAMLEDVANIERDFKVEGRYVNMLVTPKK
ncbi:translation initiation factor IF-3 [Helicobacter turcicus]|uniref:Translation initiation factor IF-3 n=1 Tax=Helicobacter turcicus TaxID=2867412 RepID=A0ABS7JNA7_9HELI|nr:translation initiation factor IF-3 [Helicobacter turcicus]MBX7490862.1 translation initiation factor IF-3 [Helicobacter turcicus]MBX7545716.1 translation initiation factor IF-3 [Helicobacter turcicus]